MNSSPEIANSAPQTLFEKIWQRHAILTREDGQTLLYIDSHFLQDGSAPAFELLRQRGLKPRAPAPGLCHARPLRPHPQPRPRCRCGPGEARAWPRRSADDSAAAGIAFFGLDDARQGIVHVVAPEQGLSQPGMLIVCGDSHTSTHGALGRSAFGIGATEVAHVLATQTLWQRKPKTLRVTLDGVAGGRRVRQGHHSRDHREDRRGRRARATRSNTRARRCAALSMEARLTVCNMSIEAGARAGMIAPDDTTFAYLEGRPFAPQGAAWDQARRALAHAARAIRAPRSTAR